MKLSISISSKNGEFSQALAYIKNQVEEGFSRGFDKNENEGFYYEIEEANEKQ
jgi:hypothetical protein